MQRDAMINLGTADESLVRFGTAPVLQPL